MWASSFPAFLGLYEQGSTLPQTVLRTSPCCWLVMISQIPKGLLSVEGCSAELEIECTPYVVLTPRMNVSYHAVGRHIHFVSVNVKFEGLGAGIDGLE
jgi:hypothetical protein